MTDKETHLKVWAPPHLINHASGLVNTLLELGYLASLTSEIVYDEDDTSVYILYCFWLCNTPKNYIIYQVENEYRFYSREGYSNVIENAIAIWGYSTKNIKLFKNYYQDEVYFVPPGFIRRKVNIERDIGVLFYGWWTNRRQRVIDELKRLGVEVKLIWGRFDPTFGDAMLDILGRTKIVLNIHAEDESPLELFRIHEALSCGCIVISEVTTELESYPIDYYRFITFASTQWMIANYVKMILSSYDYAYGSGKSKEFDISILDNKDYVQKAMEALC